MKKLENSLIDSKLKYFKENIENQKVYKLRRSIRKIIHMKRRFSHKSSSSSSKYNDNSENRSTNNSEKSFEQHYLKVWYGNVDLRSINDNFSNISEVASILPKE